MVTDLQTAVNLLILCAFQGFILNLYFLDISGIIIGFFFKQCAFVF